MRVVLLCFLCLFSFAVYSTEDVQFETVTVPMLGDIAPPEVIIMAPTLVSFARK